MKIIFGITVFLLLIFTACQKNVDGCQHPRAKNFNPEADRDPNSACEYYQLQPTFQHTTNGTDTFFVGQWFLDSNGDTFTVNQVAFLGSAVHLIHSDDRTEQTSIDEIILYSQSSSPLLTEDNFFIGQPGLYTYDAAGWIEVGIYDSITFCIGVPPAVSVTKQSSVEESQHPLSNTAITNMYVDSTDTYSTCKVQLTQNSNDRKIILDLVTYVPFRLAKTISVLDGVDTAIPIQINYTNLFSGLSLNTDTDSIIQVKLTQNLPNAFSTY